MVQSGAAAASAGGGGAFVAEIRAAIVFDDDAPGAPCPGDDLVAASPATACARSGIGAPASGTAARPAAPAGRRRRVPRHPPARRPVRHRRPRTPRRRGGSRAFPSPRRDPGRSSSAGARAMPSAVPLVITICPGSATMPRAEARWLAIADRNAGQAERIDRLRQSGGAALRQAGSQQPAPCLQREQRRIRPAGGEIERQAVADRRRTGGETAAARARGDRRGCAGQRPAVSHRACGMAPGRRRSRARVRARAPATVAGPAAAALAKMPEAGRDST